MSGKEPREVCGICKPERIRDRPHRIVRIEELPFGFQHDPRMHQLDGRLSGHREAGITQAQSSANQANQAAQSAGTAASQANQSAQEAVNRADSLASVVGNLDNYKQIADAQVNFGG